MSDGPTGTDSDITPYISISNFPGRNARRKILIHLQFKIIFLNQHVVDPHSRNERNKDDVPYRRAALQSALHMLVFPHLEALRLPFSTICISCDSTDSDTGIQNQNLEI